MLTASCSMLNSSFSDSILITPHPTGAHRAGTPVTVGNTTDSCRTALNQEELRWAHAVEKGLVWRAGWSTDWESGWSSLGEANIHSGM